MNKKIIIGFVLISVVSSALTSIVMFQLQTQNSQTITPFNVTAKMETDGYQYNGAITIQNRVSNCEYVSITSVTATTVLYNQTSPYSLPDFEPFNLAPAGAVSGVTNNMIFYGDQAAEPIGKTLTVSINYQIVPSGNSGTYVNGIYTTTLTISTEPYPTPT